MNSVWLEIKNFISGLVSENNYKIWIDPLQPLRLEGRTLYLGCPNRFFLSWVKENYQDQFRHALEIAKSAGLTVEAIVFDIAPPATFICAEASPRQGQPELPNLNVYTTPPLRFNPRFTFNRFIIGANNHYAYAATQAMATGQELHTDILYLLSDPGLGKSHLSQALGHQVLRDQAHRRVYYLTAEEFTNELVYSIKNRTPEEFKNKYRRLCDVLVLEEIQFLSGKEKIQTELSYTLDCLIENKKKVVMTSAHLPKNIPRLGRQLASRLSHSLISTIEAPDGQTRLKILEQYARENGLQVPEVVLDFLARRITRDVRKLESSLTSLGAKSRLLKRPLDLELAQETLGDLIEPQGTIVGLEAIKALICKYYQISAEDLLSRSRKKNVVLPRNVGMYLGRLVTDSSLGAIGDAFGRNHSTVLYAVNLIEQRSRRDPKLQAQVDFLARQLGPHQPVN